MIVGGQTTSYGSAAGGLDLGAASFWTDAIVEAGITNGSFSQALLDDKAVRNVIGYFFTGQDDGTFPALADASDYVDVRSNHVSYPLDREFPVAKRFHRTSERS